MKGMALLGTATVLLVMLLTALVSAMTAHGQGFGSFGIRPTETTIDDPTAGAYFTYSLEPGIVRSDEAYVVNNSADPLTLTLYAADGITATSGGTAFADAGQTRNGVGAWISMDTTELTLQPGQSTTVTFQVNVPADAPPGDHVAGLIVEAPPKAAPAGGLGAAVIERVGVAVVVTVSGPTDESLALGTICLNQETGSNYFQIPVTNDGDVLTRATGSLRLTLNDGTQIFDEDVTLDTVLPGDTTALRVDAPFDPGPGDYVANLILNNEEGTSTETASVVEIDDAKVNGCAGQVAGRSDDPDQDGTPVTGRPTAEDDGTGFPWIIASLVAAIGLLIGLIVIREAIWRRRRPRGEV